MSLFDRKLAVRQFQLAWRHKRSLAAVVRPVSQAVIEDDMAVVFPVRKARAGREHRERDQDDIHQCWDGHIERTES
jgi:hypothetical protein